MARLFLGHAISFVRWTWSILNVNTGAYLVIGDNSALPSWRWARLTFNIPAPFSRFVNPTTRAITIRQQAASGVNAELLVDLTQVVFTTGAVVSPPTTPPPVTPPTATPTTPPVVPPAPTTSPVVPPPPPPPPPTTPPPTTTTTVTKQLVFSAASAAGAQPMKGMA
eukprot:tig00020563_g11337.t1